MAVVNAIHKFHYISVCHSSNSQKCPEGEWLLLCNKEESPYAEEDTSRTKATFCIKTGLWRIGKGSCGQMKQRLVELGQMGRHMYGRRGENSFLIKLQL